MAYGKNCYQGKFTPKNPEKYKGDVSNITFRSSWERIAFNYLDMHPGVIQWASEEIIIPYISPIDGKRHRYYVDLYFKIKDSNGNIKSYLAEIKPYKFTMPPLEPKRKTKQYIQEVTQYAVNQAKWKAATEVCKDNDIGFLILTENELGIR